jgi:hypothetical protein
MASNQGYMDGSYDFKHMYNIQDLKGSLPEPFINPNSIFGFLKQINCVQFTNLLETQPIVGTYNDTQACHTVFAPMNLDLNYVLQLDDYKKRQLILYHTLPKPFSVQFLQSSKGMNLNTMQPGNNIYCSSINGDIYLNGYAKVLNYINTGKSSIFVIDKMLYPDVDPLSNMII